MKATLKFDFDWKDYYSMLTSATVELKGKGDAAQALKDIDDEVRCETANDAIAFIPDTVNGEEVARDEEFNEFFWATAACLTYLKRHPEARVFKMEGRME